MEGFKRIFAVDFDGTLCRGGKYPDIGRPNYYLIEFLKDKREKGDIVILWTCRCDKELEAAVSWCKSFGLEFDYVNENTKENKERFKNDSRKVFADYYIDDKSLLVNDMHPQVAHLSPDVWNRSYRLMSKGKE